MKYTKLPDGIAKGATDLQRWSSRRISGKSGTPENHAKEARKEWLYGRNHQKHASRISKLRRLMRKGIFKPMSKAEMRNLCDQAALQITPKNFPPTSSNP